MNRLTSWLFLAVLSCTALTAAASSQKQFQASMLVTGSIIVAPDGTVRSFTLDQTSKLPSAVVDLMNKGVPSWRFAPTKRDGQPVAAAAKMSVRVIAQPQDNGNYVLRMSGAQFDQNTNAKGSLYANRILPTYPASAIRDRVAGSVYLLVRVNKQGQAVDAFAEQVNLDAQPGGMPSESTMKRWRSLLANASLDAVRKWTFPTPGSNDHSMDGYWYARVPINFSIADSLERQTPEYGKWDIYVPGPVEQNPWDSQSRIADRDIDALPDGSISLADQGLHLVTPLGGS